MATGQASPASPWDGLDFEVGPVLPYFFKRMWEIMMQFFANSLYFFSKPPYSFGAIQNSHEHYWKGMGMWLFFQSRLA